MTRGRAGVMLSNNVEMPDQDQAPLQVWFAPDPRIKTKAATAVAIGLARDIAAGAEFDDPPDETTLFQALHVCAYRGTRRAPRGTDRELRRVEWIQRWLTVREYIVQQNLGLVHLMVARFRTTGVEADDLFSDALLALLRSVERFDPWRGVRFSTFACNVILRDLMRRAKRVGRYRRLFPVQYDAMFERPQPTPDIRIELQLSVERLERALENNLAGLTDLESLIIAQRFPFNRTRRRTLQQVGDWIGVSKERVRQIQNQALGKLRQFLDPAPPPTECPSH